MEISIYKKEKKDDFKRVIELTRQERYKEAMTLFEEGEGTFHTHEALSCYALSIANHDFYLDAATKLCLVALRRDPKNPAIYLNLGKIFNLSNKKRTALRAFKKGMKKDIMERLHPEFIEAIASMGIRRTPVIPFLSRNNFLNRMLGRLISSLGRDVKPNFTKEKGGARISDLAHLKLF